MKTNLINNRQIRVFISSTFQDMQDERDHLMQRTFPMLRKLAAERDVTLTELDLRWGITVEEAKSGKVVEICLREIENSIPFFIGIIGNRYGWVPEKSDLGGSVTERFPDVNKFIEQHLSVTEMEMQFGVLAREEDMHAYFYIKEQEEEPDKEDYPEMLNRLKQEVYKSKYPSSEYKSPEDLAQQVEEAFINLLDTLFPESNLSELEKERIGQRSFMNQLCLNYIPDDKNFQVLDDWLQDWNQHQMVVTGASGLGKSALIANWLKQKLSDNSCEYNIIYHFTGNGGSESNSEHITKAIANEIKDIYGWEYDNSETEVKLEDLFVRVSAEGNKPLLIVIDAINQIVDVDNTKLLNWLPIPTKGIKILFSTLEDDRTMEVFKYRKYPIFTLQPIDIESRSQLVRSYLKLYAKSLTEKQVERIVSDSQCENTLVLKTLLDELINFGIYEKLDERIDYYLAAETIDDFYQALIASYENDYREYGDYFIKHILSLILLSRDGLKEDEIIKITRVKPVYWSQFYCSFISHFTLKNGYLRFSHNYIAEAIYKRFINNKEWVNKCRKEIISNHIGKDTRHSIEELLYQYFAIEEFSSMHSILLNLKLFRSYFKLHPYELGRYWSRLVDEGYSVSEYLFIEDDTISTMHKRNCYVDLCAFSQEIIVDFELAIKFAHKALEISSKETDEHNKKISEANLYNILGGIYSDLYNLQEAINYNEKALEIQKSIIPIDKHELSVSYGNLGLEYLKIKDIDKGLEYCKLALKLKKEVYGDSHPMLASAYNNLGLAYKNKNNFEYALINFQKAIDIQLTNYGEEHKDIAIYYNNMSHLYGELKGQFDKSIEYALKVMDVREKTTGKKTPEYANAIHDVGYIYGELGDLNKKLEYTLKALEIGKSIWGEKHPYIGIYYSNLSSVYAELKNYEDAIHYQEIAQGIRLSTNYWKQTDIAYYFKLIGIYYRYIKQYDLSIRNCKKSIEIYSAEMGHDSQNVAYCYNSIAITLQEKGDLISSLDYFNKAYIIRQKILPEGHSDLLKSKEYINNITKEIKNHGTK